MKETIIQMNYENLDCQICNKKETNRVIKGNECCYYCGNEVRICDDCLEILKKEINKD